MQKALSEVDAPNVGVVRSRRQRPLLETAGRHNALAFRGARPACPVPISELCHRRGIGCDGRLGCNTTATTTPPRTSLVSDVRRRARLGMEALPFRAGGITTRRLSPASSQAWYRLSLAYKANGRELAARRSWGPSRPRVSAEWRVPHPRPPYSPGHVRRPTALPCSPASPRIPEGSGHTPRRWLTFRLPSERALCRRDQFPGCWCRCCCASCRAVRAFTRPRFMLGPRRTSDREGTRTGRQGVLRSPTSARNRWPGHKAGHLPNSSMRTPPSFAADAAAACLGSGSGWPRNATRRPTTSWIDAPRRSTEALGHPVASLTYARPHAWVEGELDAGRLEGAADG
jgi:hypothetical protein